MAGIAKLVLGLLLFAQAAVAVAACDWGQRAPARAVAAMAAMSENPCCAEDEAPGGLAGNANLCLAHCTSDAQSVDTSAVALPALSTAAVLTVSPMLPSRSFVLRRASSIDYAFTAPPASILFQNFRV